MEKETCIPFYFPEKHWLNSLHKEKFSKPIYQREIKVTFTIIHSMEEITSKSLKEKKDLVVFLNKKTLKDLDDHRNQLNGYSLHFITKKYLIPFIVNAYETFHPKSFSHWKDIQKSPLNLSILEQIKSKSFTKTIVQQRDRNSEVDVLDYSLLNLLRQGVQTKDLPKQLPASKSVLYRRKNPLKSILQVEGKSDVALVCKAISMGFIEVGH